MWAMDDTRLWKTSTSCQSRKLCSTETVLLYCNTAKRTRTRQPGTCSGDNLVLKRWTKLRCFSNRRALAFSELSTRKTTSTGQIRASEEREIEERGLSIEFKKGNTPPLPCNPLPKILLLHKNVDYIFRNPLAGFQI